MNKERLSSYNKEWKAKNKDKIRAREKEYRERNKEHIKKRRAEHYKSGYYKNKLVQRFNVLKDELLIGNDSEELLEELNEILDQLLQYELIDEDEFNNIKNILSSM